MSIMERLAEQSPYFNKRVQVNPIYRIAKEYFGDIEAAKKGGYSWTQINKAVAAECESLGKWDKDWNCYRIQDMYNIVKSEMRTNEKLA